LKSALYRLVRPLLFTRDPEAAHDAAVRSLAAASSTAAGRAGLRALFHPGSVAPVEAFGVRFEHPVGIAAGFDKDARCVLGLGALGFSHVEVGTVTPRPQPGNARPRIHRLPERHALRNHMGFPSDGAEVVARRLEALPLQRRVRVGVNIGKNRDTPLERATADYVEVLRILEPFADYLAVNVSSPNTPGLRRLQAREHLSGILAELVAARQRAPLLVKLSPDLDEEGLDETLGCLLEAGVDGVIATNTTRAGLAEGEGGLSGAPLRRRATEVAARIRRVAGERLAVVGVGGILDAVDVRERLAAGADLVQVYTGLVYGGPGLVGSLAPGFGSV